MCVCGGGGAHSDSRLHHVGDERRSDAAEWKQHLTPISECYEMWRPGDAQEKSIGQEEVGEGVLEGAGGGWGGPGGAEDEGDRLVSFSLNQIGDELNTRATLYSTTAAPLDSSDFVRGQEAVQYAAARSGWRRRRWLSARAARPLEGFGLQHLSHSSETVTSSGWRHLKSHSNVQGWRWFFHWS